MFWKKLEQASIRFRLLALLLPTMITVTATSREQLDELYRTLTTHPMVKMVI